jgi:CBS-domain-containing membrane protein
MAVKDFVKDIYRKSVVVISQDLTLKEALQMMVEKSFNALVVVDGHNNLKGILSTQDIASATIPSEMQYNVSLAQAMFKPGFFEEMCQDIGKRKVKEVMRTNYVTAQAETNIMEVVADFLNHDLYIVPVLDEKGNITGIVTRTEIKKALAQGMGIQLHEERK